MIDLGLEAWHERLLEFVLFGLLFFGVYSMLKVTATERFRCLFPFLNALLLTLFTIGCSGQFPFLLEKQTMLFSGLHRFQSQLHQNQPLNVALGNNRLLLVDVSHDLALIPDSSLNETWRPYQLITDRQKLTQFLESLSNPQDSAAVDMVVCDLTFGDFSPDKARDNALLTALNSLNAQGKLLMAKSKLEENKSVMGQSAINTDSLTGGSVDITKYYEGTFFSYNLFDEESASAPSLPYVLFDRLSTLRTTSNPYCRTNSVKTTKGFWTSDKFVPDFWIDNADVSRAAEPPPPWWKKLVNGSNAESDTAFQDATGRLRDNFFYLGQVTDTDTSEFSGNKAFTAQLHDNDDHCKRNIIFIGVFEDTSRDMHQTLIGPMHGSVLLINMFINLLAGSHLIGWGYFFYLMVGFVYVNYLMMYKPYRLPEYVPANKKSGWNFICKKSHELIEKILDQQDYIAAFLVLIGAITCFNHPINLVIVGFYMGITKEIYEYLLHEKRTIH